MYSVQNSRLTAQAGSFFIPFLLFICVVPNCFCQQNHIDGGFLFSLYICNDGSVKAFGEDGTYVKLGDNQSTTTVFTPQTVTGLTSGYIGVAACGEHGMALKNDGSIKCWGRADFGECGNNAMIPPTTEPFPVTVYTVGGCTNIIGISAGYYHSLALKNDGTVWAWGKNDVYQLGDGTTTNRSAPVQVKGVGGVGNLTGITALASGDDYSLALNGSTGVVYAWGYNNSGQCGDGTTATIQYPKAVSVVTNVTKISSKGLTSMFLQSDGKLYICGENFLGQCGDGTSTDIKTPWQVDNTNLFMEIAAGRDHCLALKTDGTTIRAWGVNSQYQLGIGNNTSPQRNPQTVSVTTVANRLAAGDQHSFALKANGSVKSWGLNFYGELGDGTGNTTDNIAHNVAFSGGACTKVLPVDLIDFSASYSEGIVKLNWQTASELNNDYFSVERSADGKSWEAIGNVKGFGNSSIKHEYEFIDETTIDISDSHVYYRLKQVDYNGAFEYFGPISLRFIYENGCAVIVHNNPSNSRLLCTVLTSEKTVFSAEVIDLLGGEIEKKLFNAEKGSNLLQFDIEDFSDGIYFVKLTDSKGKHMEKKFIKSSR